MPPVRLSPCWGQMARGRARERWQQEDLFQLDRSQEGKREGRKRSRDGLGLLAHGDPEVSGCCRGFHKALNASEGPRQCRGSGREVCSQRGAHRNTHSLLPCRPLGGSTDMSGETGTRNRGRDHPLALPARRRGNAHPEGSQSHQPSTTEAPGSGITQSSGQRLARGEAAPSGTWSSWLCLLELLSPLKVSPHHHMWLFSTLVLPTESLKLGKTLKIESNH